MGEMQIPFNKLCVTGNELQYIHKALIGDSNGRNINFIEKCQSKLNEILSYEFSLLTHSCTGALEMISLLIDIQEGDEVILPSFTYVSTANAFALRGAKLVFADCRSDFPNIDEDKIANLITKRTKAIVIVHYAGVSCDMLKLEALCSKHNLFLIEDAAHAITSKFNGQFLGGIGDFGVLSFHNTKNISCGEGGLLVINRSRFIKKAEIIWEKGTNRLDFNRKFIKKYEWVGLGSSFMPSEISASMLYAQLLNIDSIQEKRKQAWNYYFDALHHLELKSHCLLPKIMHYAEHNSHVFYLILNSEKTRDEFIKHNKAKGISVHPHYLPLHDSPYFKSKHDGRKLENADKFSKQLIRLPLYVELSRTQQDYIIDSVNSFFENVSSPC